MNRRSSIGRTLAWILLAVCFLPAVLRADVQAPPTAGDDHSAAGTADTANAAVHRLTAVEATPVSDGVRVFLETDGAVTARPFVLNSPERLVVDLEDVQSALAKSRYDVNSPLMSRVRVGQRREGARPVARVVFDLKETRPYTVEPAPGGIVVTVGSGSGSANAGAMGAEPADGAMPPAHGAARASATGAMPATDGAVMDHRSANSAAGSGGKLADAPSADAAAPSDGRPVLLAQNTGGGGTIEPAPAMKEGKPLEPSAAVQEGRNVPPAGATFQTTTIAGEAHVYTGKKISLNLVDADIKQVFRLFHEISGLNFVLDPGVSGNVTIVLDDVPWDQALDLILKNNGLDKVYEDNVIRIATTQKLASEAGGRKALREAKELEIEPVTITRRLSYAKAKEVDAIIKTGVLLSARGKSYFDDRTNTLIVTDVPTKVEPLDRLITNLDSKTPQVMIEARIVLTGRDFIQDLGIDWGFGVNRASKTDTSVYNDHQQREFPPQAGSPLGHYFPDGGDVTYGLNLPRASAANLLAFNLFNRTGSFQLNVALDALETEGRSRTLSAPKIATQNNVKAEIEQGVQIPIGNSSATTITFTFVSASLKLSVLPQITAEGTVIMDITVENNSPSDTIKGTQGVPGIDTQRAQTRVMVEDGGTTVIGGIFQVKDSTGESGVPFLRKIPIFGWLFKSRNITTQNRELLIFITPKILGAGA